MTNSRAKGKRGELEAAAELRVLGFSGARRGQQFHGGADSPDIAEAIPGVHFEVKRVEALNLFAALDQAKADAGAGMVPVVLHRRNRRPWVAIVELRRLRDLTQCLGLAEWNADGEDETEGEQPRG